MMSHNARVAVCAKTGPVNPRLTFSAALDPLLTTKAPETKKEKAMKGKSRVLGKTPRQEYEEAPPNKIDRSNNARKPMSLETTTVYKKSLKKTIRGA